MSEGRFVAVALDAQDAELDGFEPPVGYVTCRYSELYHSLNWCLWRFSKEIALTGPQLGCYVDLSGQTSSPVR